MSISGIGAGHVAGHAHKSTSTASGQGAVSGAAGSIANTGSVSAGNMDAFFKSLSDDLQSILSQGGKSATSGTTTQTAANQPVTGAHHSPVRGGSGETTAQIGQGQAAGLTAGGIGHAAGVFAANVTQALKAYGATLSA
jgi:hypothetical protein